MKTQGWIETAAVIAPMLAVNAGVAFAHHGMEGYDASRVVELEGEVVDFELNDPHSVLYVNVVNSDGSVTPRAVEGGAAGGIESAGLSKEFLASGPTVHITAHKTADKVCEPTYRAMGKNFRFQGL